jgi:hypothetical protein
MSYLFGLHPWHIEQLTEMQWDWYRRFADDWRESDRGR